MPTLTILLILTNRYSHSSLLPYIRGTLFFDLYKSTGLFAFPALLALLAAYGNPERRGNVLATIQKNRKALIKVLYALISIKFLITLKIVIRVERVHWLVAILSSELISSRLLEHYPMNVEQQAIVSHKEGPLLVIAGPGSGKTYSLTLLAMNLLLCGHAQPEEIILCTYTQKAAYEMQDRISHIAQQIHYTEDLSPLKVGTIHSLCNQMITRYLHHTPLGNNYTMLDEFTQRFLIYQNLDRICSSAKPLFIDEWGSPWDLTKRLQFFFGKITEELIFPRLKDIYLQPGWRSQGWNDILIGALTRAYHRYQQLLTETNSIDFAHLQKCAYNLLEKPETFHTITKHIRYVLVDEYQDTNYIQEQLLNKLASASATHNLCVVGDEDQALYRFRGATVRNILEFEQVHPDCKQIKLTKNYRSHPQIISLYNQWMEQMDWSHPQGKHPFRMDKVIIPAKIDEKLAAYPAVLSMQGRDVDDEARLSAHMIATLKQQGQIQDYSQVAILLRSVRAQISDVYIAALQELKIPAYCSRAHTFFLSQEIQLIIGCFARLLRYHAIRTENLPDQLQLDNYLKGCRDVLAQSCIDYTELDFELIDIETEIFQKETNNKQPVRGLIDYFYRLIFTEPFKTRLQAKEQLHNLVQFSQLLHTFQRCYPAYQSITLDNQEALKRDFLHTFLCLLHEDGINQLEDAQQPFPAGHVQILTIHQAKGLEFPVVIVGHLDKLAYQSTLKDKILRAHYHQQPEEPEERVPRFDVHRLYYVAFSRAKQLLILTTKRQPDEQLAALWSTIPSLQQTLQTLPLMPPANEVGEYIPPKRRFSFTGHVRLYETCPRRFEFLQEHHFQSSHTSETFYGQLVHQTLEAIHRIALERDFRKLEQHTLQELFEKTYTFLSLPGIHPLDKQKKELALQQIFAYVDQNMTELRRIKDVELSVQVEKRNYILSGKIDLLLETTQGVEIVDFKTGLRRDEDAEIVELYKKQLYLYAHAVERRWRKLPARLFIYWTSEPNKDQARMELPCEAENIHKADTYFDHVVSKIQARQFDVLTPPSPNICKTCDVRHLCHKEKLI